jgi:hypothetical protein
MHYNLSNPVLLEDFFYEEYFPEPRSQKDFIRYKKFINSRKFRNIPEGVYTEIQHILPVSFTTKNWSKKEINYPHNLLILTAREHLLSHLMLRKAFGGKMSQAFFLMIGYRRYSESFSLKEISIYRENSNKEFNWVKLCSKEKYDKWKQSVKESCNTPEFKQLMSKILKERYKDLDQRKNTSIDSKKAWQKQGRRKEFSEKRKAKGNPMFGKTHSKEWSKNHSENMSGRKFLNNEKEQQLLFLDSVKAQELLNKGWKLGKLPLKKIKCITCGEEYDPGNYKKHQNRTGH